MGYPMTPMKGDPSEHVRCQRQRSRGPYRACPATPVGHWRVALLAIAGVAAAVLIVACGDDERGTISTATATPTAATSPTASPSPEQQLLQQVVLRADDLPAGLVQVAATTSTNEDIAADSQSPDEEVARLESLGRLLGYEVNFVPGPESPPESNVFAVTSAASLYRTPDGASASFADAAQDARNSDWAAAYTDLTEMEVREVERPDLADEVVWIRITGIQDGESGSLFIEDFVVLRRDRLRGFLRVVSLVEASAGRDAFLQNVEELTALHVRRIDTVVEGGQP